MGGKEKEGRMGGRGKRKGGEGKGDRMWRGPESGLPRGPCWLSAGLPSCKISRPSVPDICNRTEKTTANLIPCHTNVWRVIIIT